MMAKLTKKYSAAMIAAQKHNIPMNGNQEELYASLNKAGMIWDSNQSKWLDITNEHADPASDVLRVRVWAKTEDVEKQAGHIMQALLSSGYILVERSQPYVCRPPKQLESRVYLSFLKK